MVSSKIFAVILVIASHVTAVSAIKCLSCTYNTAMSAAEQKCNDSVTIECTGLDTHCEAETIKKDNGELHYTKGCGNAITCQAPAEFCKLEVAKDGIAGCAATCCQNDKCNTALPSISGAPTVAAMAKIGLFTSLLVAVAFVA